MTRKLLSFDALLLLLLVLVRVRVDTLVIAVIPRPSDLIAQVPILGGILSSEALRLLADPMADPVSTLLITATFSLIVGYLLFDLWENWLGRERSLYRVKLIILYLIIFLMTGIGTLLVVGLRHISEPARYAHDGGVLITESAIKYLMEGKNPYVETYRGTPAEQAFPNGPGLSHYAYLPWAFLSGVPFYVVSQAILGWYDQRFVYLIALALTLALVPRLASRPGDKLALIMLVGLNPIMGNDIVYGMNDILVVCWLVLAAYLVKVDRLGLSACAMGLAVATKSTVWPILPFYLLYLFREELKGLPRKSSASDGAGQGSSANGVSRGEAGFRPVGASASGHLWSGEEQAPNQPEVQISSRGLKPTVRRGGFETRPYKPHLSSPLNPSKLSGRLAAASFVSPLPKVLPLVATTLIVVLPFAIWNLGAMVEDTWSYNMGSTIEDALPIRGWGLANLMLAFGWVKDTMDYFPFWVFEGLFALPVLGVLLLRQWRHNTLDAMFLNYGLFFLVFVFLSRTMNANYVGYALTLLAIGYLGDDGEIRVDRATD